MILNRIIFLIVLITPVINAQYNGFDFSISSSLVYTTSAELYLNPNSVDPVIRNSSFEINDVLNPSIDIRYRLSEPLIVGISGEYIRTNQTGRNLTVLQGNNELRLESTDGFKLIPIETSLYYQLPFSTKNLKFLMGGGTGIYFGDFTRSFGDTDISTIERQVAFGIHVSVSMEYLPLENVGLRFEMKFRDPEFKSKNKYNKDIVNYNGTEIILLRDTFNTKVNVNGVTFLLGAAIYL
ncbi:MAG: hypothetical protein R6W68_15295 [Ignavibacteriaceae bacterium]